MFRRASSTGRGRALIVVVARTVKEAPDWEPQCGVGMGEISSDFTLLLSSRNTDVMMVVLFVLDNVCCELEIK